MVRSTINVDLVWKKKKTALRRYDVKALNDSNKCDLFEIELNNRFLPLADNNFEDIDSFSQSLNSAILDTTEK